MSSTPVMDSGLAAAVQAESLQRSLSHLSLSSEDLQQVGGSAALPSILPPRTALPVPP